MEKFIYIVFAKDDFTPRTPYKVYLINKAFTTLDGARNYIKGQNKREHIIIPLDEDGEESWCGFDIKKMKVED